MKKHYISLIFIFLVLHLNAQIVNIPDSSFKARLLASSADNEISKDLSGNYFAIDANGDNEIQASEALNVATLDISSANIYSLAGLEGFTNLQTLDCSYNGISTLNGSALPALTSLNCGGNSLLPLDMSNLSNLQSLYCESNGYTTLDVSSLSNLQDLYCGYNDLHSLTVIGLSNLKNLDCSGNELHAIELAGLNNLETLSCRINHLSALAVTNLSNLQVLICDDNQITALDVSGLDNLRNLHCNDNQLTTLNLNGISSLWVLYCYNNHLTTLNANGLADLIYLDCGYNHLNELTLIGSNNLERLESRNNFYTTLDLNNKSHFQFLGCQNNDSLTTLYLKNGVLESINSNNSHNVSYVCADDFQLGQIQSHFGFSCTVTSDCDLSVQAISNQSKKIRIYPNPVADTLLISGDEASVCGSIYNLLGQLVLPFKTSTVDVANLKSGNNIVKLSMKSGNYNIRFVKQ